MKNDGFLKLVVNSELTSSSPHPRDIFSNEERCFDHEKILKHYLLSKELRNHAVSTIKNTEYMLHKFFDECNKVCWETTVDDVNEFHQSLIDSGLSVSTRRSYLNTISNFYRFLLAHPEIPVTIEGIRENRRPERVDWKYGVKLIQPIDPWFRPMHSSEDNSVDTVIPTRSELREFFKFLRITAGKAKKPLGFQRDYAMFLLMYHTGIRQNECRMLDTDDIDFERGTVHVRFGKGTKGSGRRERWVPLTLHNIDDVMKVYLKHYRPHFLNADQENALFLSEHGFRISESTIKRRLQENIEAAIENGIDIKYFTCHDLRRAFATHFYEKFPHKIEVVRHMLGHSLLATTQRYLRPSAVYFEQQLEGLTTGQFRRLLEDDDND